MYSSNVKSGFKLQDTYGGQMTVTVPLEKKRDKGKRNVAASPLLPKYPEPMLISKEKLADVKVLMTYVVPEHKPFFTNLVAEQEKAHAKATGGRATGAGRGRGGQESDVDFLDDDPDNPAF